MREAYLSVDTFSLCELQLLLKFLVFNDLLLASSVRFFSITVALAEQKASSRPLHGLLCNLLIFKERFRLFTRGLSLEFIYLESLRAANLLNALVLNDLCSLCGVCHFFLTGGLAEQIQEIPYRIMILIPPTIALFAAVPNMVGGIPFLNGPAVVAFLSCILRRQFLGG